MGHASSRVHTKAVLVVLSFIVTVFLFTLSLQLQPKAGSPMERSAETRAQEWFRLVSKDFNRRIKMGLVNVESEYARGLEAEVVRVEYERVPRGLKWEDLFPEWIDEEEKWGPQECPEIAMPRRMEEEYGDVDVVVVRGECKGRDVGSLQANLVAANVAVTGGGWARRAYQQQPVYVVVVGDCGPMPEIFRCDDMVMKGEGYRVYRPELTRLKQITLMPFGTCQFPPGISKAESYRWRYFASQTKWFPKKEAYVTMLHSSEEYVCGAIALGQSIKLTNSTKDMVLLADQHISPESREALTGAGWNVRELERIRSPHAVKGSYNEWNYSKLRIWQLTIYDTILFIDSDLLVLSNLDHLFRYPELSASPNSKTMFNSGVMVVEPSQCMFDTLMGMTRSLPSYNRGDQGFLNEAFPWWHRLPSSVNYLKMFQDPHRRILPPNLHALHFLGVKPWLCYRDYDCNWDIPDRQVFASDSAHRRWFHLYDTLPHTLTPYCRLTELQDWRIRKWRRIAAKAKLGDGHWKIKVTDNRALPSNKQRDFS